MSKALIIPIWNFKKRDYIVGTGIARYQQWGKWRLQVSENMATRNSGEVQLFYGRKLMAAFQYTRMRDGVYRAKRKALKVAREMHELVDMSAAWEKDGEGRKKHPKMSEQGTDTSRGRSLGRFFISNDE